MKVRKRQFGKSSRRGSVLVQALIFGSVVGVGVAALTVDTGLMYTAKQELQSAADAAALAAAAQLGAKVDPTGAAAQEAALFASRNEIAGRGYTLDVQTSVVFGHAVLNGEKYDFWPNVQPYDAVHLTLRRDSTAADGPVSLLFAKAFGMDGAQLQASATAMIVPRDISVVIDFSGSMNDDSELRHFKDFPSESGGTRPGVQINLKDIWYWLPIVKGNAGVGNGLDPPPPGNPNNENDQPGTGPGHPANAGGNPDPGADPGDGVARGPRWGWMTGWGYDVVLGSYTPVTDTGLYYIPKGYCCTDADVQANLTESGYYPGEVAALLSSQFDSDSTLYVNRTMVCLGLAGWKSKQHDGNTRLSKYNGGPGNGDNKVQTNELCHEVEWPFTSGNWTDYINYVRSNSTEMYGTDSSLRYRYGIKTVVNYLLEKQSCHEWCPELAATPEEPLKSVKNAVQAMIDEIVSLDTDDHVSLEAFAQYGYHLHDLTVPASADELPAALQEIPDTLNGYQAGHFTSVTNIGAGFQEALDELSSSRARTSAAKVVILLTDGKPNVNHQNYYVGNDAPSAISWAEDSAAELAEAGAVVYVIGVGGDVNADLCEGLATRPDNYFFADSTPDPDHNGQPMYVTELQRIFQTLGGKRPVRLIQ